MFHERAPLAPLTPSMAPVWCFSTDEWHVVLAAVPSIGVSGVAIVSVAAVCAGYLWLERHQVRRAARVRLVERRRAGVGRWCEPCSDEAGVSSRLAHRIEETVGAADVAWSYYERLFVRGPSGESPFRFRRSRVDAAQRRFARAAVRLEQAATGWLSSTASDPTVDAQARLAVRRMKNWLREHPVSVCFPVGEPAAGFEATLDILENALANLQQQRARPQKTDPFRVSGSLSRQDVTSHGTQVSARHVESAHHVSAP